MKKENNLSLRDLTKMIMALAKKKGFGTKPDEIIVSEKIALIHSEVTEAFEAYRHQNMDGKDGFREELADVAIRLIHLCGIYKIDLEKEILKKNNFNKNRDWDWEKLNEHRSRKVTKRS